jgi:hypothetical protein
MLNWLNHKEALGYVHYRGDTLVPFLIILHREMFDDKSFRDKQMIYYS